MKSLKIKETIKIKRCLSFSLISRAKNTKMNQIDMQACTPLNNLTIKSIFMFAKKSRNVSIKSVLSLSAEIISHTSSPIFPHKSELKLFFCTHFFREKILWTRWPNQTKKLKKPSIISLRLKRRIKWCWIFRYFEKNVLSFSQPSILLDT